MKGIYKVRVAWEYIHVYYGEVYRDTEGNVSVYIYRHAKQKKASKSVFNFILAHDCIKLKNGDYLYVANWEKENN